MTIWEVIILAIVEGITEFLPVSSTGHMIIASSILGISSLEFTKLLTVNIQFGAILAVVVLYWRKFFQSFNYLEAKKDTKSNIEFFFKYFDFYIKILIAFVPGAIFGFLLNDFIDSLLENVIVVAFSLIIGGIILVYVDKWLENRSLDDSITLPKAFKIGFFQCIAMVPGVSRSAATIIGGMLQGLSKTTAAEFSFFLAVPTMFAASAYKLLKSYKNIHAEQISLLLVGNLVAFVVAMLAIKFFINFLTKNGFKIFGYYRIALGLIILIFVAMGYSLKVV
jgi:undecaprenyl-diphosphatase